MKVVVKNIILLLFFFQSGLVSSDVRFSGDVLKQIKKVASEQDIEPRLLLAFARVESNGNKYAVGYNIKKSELSSHRQFYKNCNIKIRFGKYKNGYRISVYPKNITEAKITAYKVKNRKNVDFGLMQINSSNIERERVSKIAILTEPYLNLTFSAIVLRECFVKFNNSIEKTAECYNKGYNDRKFNFEYFNKIKRAYYEKNGV